MEDMPHGPLSFCLRLSPYMFSSRRTYIVNPLIRTYAENVPNDVNFVVSNGDVFEGNYLASKNCFIGLRALLRRYRMNNPYMLCFKYVGCGDFSVTVFDSAAVEIEYPEDPVRVRRTGSEYPRIPDMESFRIVEVFTMQDHLNKSLFSLNSRDVPRQEIRIDMPEQHYLELEDCVVLKDYDEGVSSFWNEGSGVYLQVGTKSWKIVVRKHADQWYFVEGWPEFATVLNIGESDLVVLVVLANPLCFEVSLYKDFATIPKCLRSAVEVPCHFIKLVTEELLETGELKIPKLFDTKYENQFDNEVLLEAPSGGLFKVIKVERGGKFRGLKKFAGDYYLQVGYVLIFTMISKSKLMVSVYDDQMVHVMD